jgi:hypothetical protein
VFPVQNKIKLQNFEGKTAKKRIKKSQKTAKKRLKTAKNG